MGDTTTDNILNQINQAINGLNNTVAAVFPQGQAVTSTAGAASGKYLTIIAPDGVTYKIALLNPV